VLLVSEAETVSDAEAAALDERAADPSVRTTGEG